MLLETSSAVGYQRSVGGVVEKTRGSQGERSPASDVVVKDAAKRSGASNNVARTPALDRSKHNVGTAPLTSTKHKSKVAKAFGKVQGVLLQIKDIHERHYAADAAWQTLRGANAGAPEVGWAR